MSDKGEREGGREVGREGGREGGRGCTEEGGLRESREGVEYTHFNFRQSFDDKVSLGFHTPLCQTFFQKLH